MGYDEVDRLRYRLDRLENEVGYDDGQLKKKIRQLEVNLDERIGYEDFDITLDDLRNELLQRQNKIFRTLARENRENRKYIKKIFIRLEQLRDHIEALKSRENNE